MQRLVLAVLVLLPLAAWAGESNPQFSGYLGDNDTATFFVRPTSDEESWWFKIPDGDYFWLKTQDSTGRELEDTDLSDHQSVTLVGAKGRKVIFRIYEIGGDGNWSAWKGTGPSSADERVVFSKPVAAKPSHPVQFSGWLGEDDTTEFFVRPESDRESWWFEIPDGEYFWVKTNDSTGREIQDTDLSDHQSVTLVGAKGRKVAFRIYEIAGEGNWSAWKGSGPAAANEDAVFSSAAPATAPPAQRSFLKPGSDGKYSGYLDDKDSTSFVVRPQSDREVWRFEIPRGEYFWLKVITDGVERADIDLSDYGSVTLVNARGKDVTFTIYEIAGEGNWSAWKSDKPAADDRAVDLAQSGQTEDPGKFYRELGRSLDIYAELINEALGHSGTLAKGESDTITITTESDVEEWKFTIPAGAKFSVKVLAANGDVLRDIDLTQSNTVKLQGVREHKLVIRAKSGSGDWSARRLD